MHLCPSWMFLTQLFHNELMENNSLVHSYEVVLHSKVGRSAILVEGLKVSKNEWHYLLITSIWNLMGYFVQISCTVVRMTPIWKLFFMAKSALLISILRLTATFFIRSDSQEYLWLSYVLAEVIKVFWKKIILKNKESHSY